MLVSIRDKHSLLIIAPISKAIIKHIQVRNVSLILIRLSSVYLQNLIVLQVLRRKWQDLKYNVGNFIQIKVMRVLIYWQYFGSWFFDV